MKLYFLGSCNAQKPLIIFENLCTQNFDFTSSAFITDGDTGICVDFCKQKGITVIKYSDVEQALIEDANIDKKVLISIGWPKLVEERLLKMWDAAINCHGSILPDYRGNRAYMHYWANMAPEYGATIHYMNAKFDDGNVIVQGRLKAFVEESQHIMHRRTAELCALLLPAAIRLVGDGYEGYVAEGEKRYFYQMTPEEFENHRKMNMDRVSRGEKVVLTRYKELL